MTRNVISSLPTRRRSSTRLPDTTARRAPENLAILLREPFRTLTEELFERLAARGHPAVRFAHGGVFEVLDDGGTRVSVLVERANVSKQASSASPIAATAEPSSFAPPPAAARSSPSRELVAEIDARLDERLGAAKVRRLRALLRELSDAL